MSPEHASVDPSRAPPLSRTISQQYLTLRLSCHRTTINSTILKHCLQAVVPLCVCEPDHLPRTVSFIFADLIVLPILDIYRKYYGWKVMGYILLTFYVTMAAAGYLVEFLFEALGIIPQNRTTVVITEGIQWNYTTVLNIIFLLLAAVLVLRFIRTGGLPMLGMMDTPEKEMAHE